MPPSRARSAHPQLGVIAVRLHSGYAPTRARSARLKLDQTKALFAYRAA
ncbi:MAG: hypothetical protein RR218_04075 [Gordonibacter sp.]